MLRTSQTGALTLQNVFYHLYPLRLLFVFYFFFVGQKVVGIKSFPSLFKKREVYLNAFIDICTVNTN